MAFPILVGLLLATPPPAPDAARVEEVVVTGSRSERTREESTANVEVIGRAEIEAAGAESVAEILESHPGVELESTFRGQAVRLQGFDPEYVLVLVDGERAQGRIGGALDLSRFSAGSIERIEIVKGAGSALYGADAVAGVINIITRRPEEPWEATGHLSSGTRGALDLSARVGGRRDTFEVGATVDQHRGAAWDLTPETVGTTSSAFQMTDVVAKAAWRPDRSFRLASKAEYLRRRQEGVADGDTGAVFDRQTLSEQASASVEADRQFKRAGRFRLTAHQGLYFDQYLSDQRGASALDQLQKSRELLTRLAVQQDIAFGTRQLLTSGAELLYEQIRTPRLQGGSGARTRGSLFVQHEWNLRNVRRLRITRGARLDGDSQFGLRVSPKVAARIDPTEATTMRAALGWGYRAPNFQELYLQFENPGAGYRVDGNPTLAPERSRSLNLDAEWRPLAKARLSLGLFRTDIRNLIVTRLAAPGSSGAPTGYNYQNVAAAHTQGLEVGLAAEIVPGLELAASYALTLARDEELDRPLEGRARHRGTFRVGYRAQAMGFAASARGTLVGARPFYESAQGEPGERGEMQRTVLARPYLTLGVRVEKSVWRGLFAFLGGDNLLDAGDERHLPIMPRTVYAGLDFRR